MYEIPPVTVHYSRHFPQITNRMLFMPECSPSLDPTNVTNCRLPNLQAQSLLPNSQATD
ncbi:hypothetical protein PISMIDRAFT_17905 [Pisolithus microcarpus 441]|uniref:Uncharacterized protein n=1 Tax=Pisolithus microcarpus 441 TaxID=765257 RepID=A0A0C9Z0M9_9AGAM|nr:hypothetical protein PISMIDRAFT_17905 [Pisolithus microcarpus 441]